MEKLNTVKPVHEVTSIKQSQVLRGHLLFDLSYLFTCDTTGVIRSRKSKVRHYNGEKTKNERWSTKHNTEI